MIYKSKYDRNINKEKKGLDRIVGYHLNSKKEE